MNEEIISSFLHLAEGHANAVSDVKALRESCLNDGQDDVAATLALAVAREEEMRAALIRWKPRSNVEAQSKLLYVAHYLISTRTTLDDQDMRAMMASIAHLRKK
ncbi:hypothetical protein [Agrobacterium arsenijevicii]|uniref:Uncharacterized protein n=1 Tax=Agrobacterium arsenijevicii TaxID=1585697 RepID=A0ABR5CZJ9_9HYPH|nr:hypothetical protein RP75_27515 [Agrobacterium arsenijevicii]